MGKATTTIVTGLVLIGAAGAGGYWYGSQRYAASNITLSQQAEAAQRRLERVGNLNHLLNARFELFKAATELDQRNFGRANTHMRNAASALASVDAAAVGADASALQMLREAITKMDIAVAVDLEAQRASVLRFGADLDALLPRSEKVAAPPAPPPPPAAAPPAAEPATSPPAGKTPPAEPPAAKPPTPPAPEKPKS